MGERLESHAGHGIFMRIFALIASLAIGLGVYFVALPQQAAQAATPPPSDVNGDVTVIAFQQTWNTIAQECTSVYGPEGVGYVEVSPPSEEIKGLPWWTSYQIVSYDLNSKEGTETEFQNMIDTCKAAGVGIVADVVTNQTTGTGWDLQGVNGTPYTTSPVNYPGFPFSEANGDFHSCTKSISDYTNQTEVQECRLSGMFDLNTGSPHVQDVISDYIAKLYDMGVRGFRMDAAKHENTNDLHAIKAKVAQKVGVASPDDIWWIQEVIPNPSEAAGIQPPNYYQNGQVNGFEYSYLLKQYFSGSVAGIGDAVYNLTNQLPAGVDSRDLINAFVANWDSERDNSTLAPQNTAAYTLAQTFLLGFSYGQPTLLSDYYFTGHDDGAPGATETSIPDVDMDTACAQPASKVGDWMCEERWTPTRGMIGFHNAVDGTDVENYAESGNSLSFDRGAAGTLVINNGAAAMTKTYSTQLPDGVYCNVFTTSNCSDTVTVSGGQFSATVGGKSAVAIYAGAVEGSNLQTTSASNPVVDPSTPGGGSLSAGGAGDNTLTVYFRVNDYDAQYWAGGGRNACIYWGVDGDPDVHSEGTCGGNDFQDVMTPMDDSQWYMYTIPNTEGQSVSFMVNDGNGWNVNAGTCSDSSNFTAPAGATYITMYQNNEGDCTAQNHGTTVIDNPFPDTVSSGKLFTANTEPYTSLDVTLHYQRDDDSYQTYGSDGTWTGWDVWQWSNNAAGAAVAFTSHDQFGEIAKWTDKNADGVSDPKFIIRQGGDAWTAKDPNDNDQSIPAQAITVDSTGKATAEVCVVSGDSTIYVYQDGECMKSMKPAEITEMDTISVDLPSTATISKSGITVNGTAIPTSSISQSGSTLTITMPSDMDMHKGYEVAIPGQDTQLAVAGSVVRTQAFDDKYDYDGDDLGATSITVNGTARTQFKLWAPTAESVQVQMFKLGPNIGEDGAPYHTFNMTQDANNPGVFFYALPSAGGFSDDDVEYDYLVTFPDGTVNESPDPYAKAATVNGEHSVFLLASETALPTAAAPKPAFDGNPTDAVVAETHIRDFSKDPSSGVDADKQGKYLGMVQTGTTNAEGQPTGVDYLKQLGITHVQIQPFFDYASVDETKPLDDSNYNWGYDPQNYDVPEGSYSSDPTNPATRIVEAKEMVDGLHQNGLRVVMDVVYNHVYDADTSAFGLTVPGYYFRYTDDGALVNDSGCGNTTASERGMMRKYILDSVKYWAQEYGVDGFRFDLMGLEDETTMNEVRAELDTIDPSMLIIGEGWAMSSTLTTEEQTIQRMAAATPTLGFFNDSLRDSMMNLSKGNQGQEPLVLHNLLGCQNDGGDDILPDSSQCNGAYPYQAWYDSPKQVVQYEEIHDGYTLYDNLKNGTGYSDDELVKRAKLDDAAVFLSMGQPEIQLGQEFLRTKNGDSNSYNAGDTENALDWDRQSQAPFDDSVAFVKGLIELRKNVPAFRMSDYETINANSNTLREDGGVVAYQLTDPETGEVYYVVLNANTSSASVSGLAAGVTYQMMIDDSQVMATTPLGVQTASISTLRAGLLLDSDSLAANLTTSVAASDPAPVLVSGSGSLTVDPLSVTVVHVLDAPVTSVVHFDANTTDATLTGSMADQTMTWNSDGALAANTFARTGYTFAGWNTAADGTGDAYTDAQAFTPWTLTDAAVTLYAQWAPDTYTLSFDANADDATGAMDALDVDYGSDAALPTNAFAREGYTFAGWNTAADGTGDAYADGAVISPWASTADVTLYAQWTTNPYVVHFDANTTDATLTGSMADIDTAFGQSVTLSENAFARTGYTFAGWNTAADGTGDAYADAAEFTTPAADTTLYAQWTPKAYTLSFDANTTDAALTGVMDAQSVMFDSDVTVAANAFARTGYTFTGWNTAADGTGTDYADGAVISPWASTADVTLYAQWTPNTYAVSFDANGGTGAMTDEAATYDESLTLTANGFARTGYTFAGWNTAADGTGDAYADAAEFTTPAADTTLYAQWTPIAVTVSFDAAADGTEGTVESLTATYGSSFTLPANGYTREGYTFAGWLLDGVLYQAGDQIPAWTLTADTTVTAQWEEIPPVVTPPDTPVTPVPVTAQVTFDANADDATGAMDAQTATVDEDLTLTANVFAREGYTFAGWNTAADGTGTDYADGAVISPWTSADDVVLYAQWTPVDNGAREAGTDETDETDVTDETADTADASDATDTGDASDTTDTSTVPEPTKPAEPQTLSDTGVDSLGIAIAAAVLLAAGVALMLSRRAHGRE